MEFSYASEHVTHDTALSLLLDLERSVSKVAKVASGCRTLHSGPRFRSRFDMFERQPQYLKTVLDNGFKFPPDYLQHADTFGRIRDALRAIDHTTVPCNNDLLAENFIEDGDRVWIIDYEYSGNNDPCFELGNLWAECGLSTDQLDELPTLIP